MSSQVSNNNLPTGNPSPAPVRPSFCQRHEDPSRPILINEGDNLGDVTRESEQEESANTPHLLLISCFS